MTKLAICYDFDKTLSPKNMQEFTFIPSIGMDKDKFWAESNARAVRCKMDGNLAWMYQMLIKARGAGVSLKRGAFLRLGENVELFSGVSEWFSLVNAYGRAHGVEVLHYIISSGLKEIVEGSKIAPEFARIYGSSFMYEDDVAVWPALAVNYTNKTQFIFRIAKGFFEEYDERVNDSVDEDKLFIPYENFVYIGDSATDVPCMRLVKSKGGNSVGVYDPVTADSTRVKKLFDEGRLSFYAKADYRESGELFDVMKKIIDERAASAELLAKRKTL